MLNTIDVIFNPISGSYVLRPHHDPLRWVIGPVSTQHNLPIPIKVFPIMLQLTDTQKCPVAVTFVDAKGAPALVNGVPVWASSDTTAATAAPAADGMSAEVIAGLPGTAKVTVTANASFGDTPAPIVGELDITVVGGQAATVTVTAGAPVGQ